MTDTKRHLVCRLARTVRHHPDDPSIPGIRRDLNAVRIVERIEQYGDDLHDSDRRRIADMILSGIGE